MWSGDIRIQSLKNYLNITKSLRKTSYNFGIPISTLSRWYKQYKDSGFSGLEIKKTHNSRVRKITEEIKQRIKELISINPFYTIKDLIEEIHIDISISSISKILRKLKITVKKIINRIEYKDKDLSKEREEFKNKMQNFKDVICLDETGIQYEMQNTLGRSKRGEKIYVKRKSIYYRKQYSCLMVVSLEEGIRYDIYKESVNKDKLLQFIKDNLEYFKNKKVLLDNVSFHKSKEIIELLKDIKSEIIYTPPYSPYLNPIEEIFSQIKRNLRKSAYSNKEYDTRISEAIESISGENAYNYYVHAFH